MLITTIIITMLHYLGYVAHLIILVCSCLPTLNIFLLCHWIYLFTVCCKSAYFVSPQTLNSNCSLFFLSSYVFTNFRVALWRFVKYHLFEQLAFQKLIFIVTGSLYGEWISPILPLMNHRMFLLLSCMGFIFIVNISHCPTCNKLKKSQFQIICHFRWSILLVYKVIPVELLW